MRKWKWHLSLKHIVCVCVCVCVYIYNLSLLTHRDILNDWKAVRQRLITFSREVFSISEHFQRWHTCEPWWAAVLSKHSTVCNCKLLQLNCWISHKGKQYFGGSGIRFKKLEDTNIIIKYLFKNRFNLYFRLLSKNLKIKIYKTVILPVVLYGCETWSLTLREEYRLRVYIVCTVHLI